MHVSLAVLFQGANLLAAVHLYVLQLHPVTTPTWPKAWPAHPWLQAHPKAFDKGGFTFL